jgi:N-acetylmuramic acid 6-phosphate (MurNAc-6-P) etherase
LMHWGQVDRAVADQLLVDHQGDLRQAVAAANVG